MSKSNFYFLKGVNDFLYKIALAAERNYPDDPNTTMSKLRIFGESVAKHIGKALQLENTDKQIDLIRELDKVPAIDDGIIKVLHTLRKTGNLAVHEYHNDLEDAGMTLRLAFRLAIWYYRLIKNDHNFVVPVFVLPSGHQETAFTKEVTELKEALQKALNTNAQTDAELEANKNKLINLNGYISILESKQHETQQQIDERVATLEAQLKQKDAELAKKTESERKTYKQEVIQRASARRLDLSEKETRYIIDQQLREAGWAADTAVLNYANGTRPQIGKNIAIAEWPTDKDETGNTGFADYVLFVGLEPLGVVEAKKINIDVCGKLNEAQRYSIYFNMEHLNRELLTQLEQNAANDPIQQEKVAEQLNKYKVTWAESNKNNARRYKIPFVFSANGREYRRQMLTKSGIWYRDVRQTNNTAKALPAWYTPAGLKAKLASDTETAHQWLDNNNPSDLGLRYFQEEAVIAAEKAIQAGQQNILLAMATGTGKTRTAIALMYRLVQSKRFNRILFLVDRRSLGVQALDAFDDTRVNDVPFNTIFNIKGLTDKFPSDATKIHVATVQSLVKRTLQSDEFMPVERYDCIIVDEAHRGYILDKEQTDGEMEFRNQLDYVSAYRRILDHFDAVKIGLTATPALHTTEIFGLPVYRYSYRKAVIDGYLTDQEPPIKIVTRLTQKGIYLDQGLEVTRLTNQGELVKDTLEDEQGFEVANFNRDIIVPSFNKVVAEALAKELDPTGNKKTLIFCVNNMHADMIVLALRDAYKDKYPDLEHDAIIKITGTSDKDPKKIQSMITRYNKERLPNIVVTVDLLSTGIDVPSICNLVFLRKVKSRILYEQMKGRATRLCPEVGKTSFKIYDAVDLYSTLESVDTMKPVVIRPQVELNTLVNEISDDKTYQTTEADGRCFAEHSHEQLVAKVQRIVSHGLFHREKSVEVEQSIKRLDESLSHIAKCDFAGLADTLKKQGPKQSAAIFTQIPNLVKHLEQLKQQINELRLEPIFTDIDDELIELKSGYGDFDTPEDFLEAFDNLVEQSENKQAALHTVITKPKDLTRKALLELQEWFDAQSFDESTLRVAWQKTTNQDIAARLIGHIRRAALGDALLPFDERVDIALIKIKSQQEWNQEQLSWLERLANSLKEQVAIDEDTFKSGNYRRRGGKRKLDAVFNGELDKILNQFNEYMWDQPA